MDRTLRLGPTHVDEGLSVRDHLPGCDKECREFRLGSRSHDELDYLGNGEDCPVEAGKWVIFGEINVAPAQLRELDSLRKPALPVLWLP